MSLPADFSTLGELLPPFDEWIRSELRALDETHRTPRPLEPTSQELLDLIFDPKKDMEKWHP